MKTFPKFKDILAERKLNGEEDVQLSLLNFYRFYLFIMMPLVIDIVFLSYKQRLEFNLNHMVLEHQRISKLSLLGCESLNI